MGVTISSVDAAQIIALAMASPDREICGLLIGEDDRINALLPAANVADDPACRFEVDPAVLFAALRGERAGHGTVVGSYHSHPHGPAKPSETDAAMIRQTNEIWLIAAGRELAAWRATVEKTFESVALILA